MFLLCSVFTDNPVSLTIDAKPSILDVCGGRDYASDSLGCITWMQLLSLIEMHRLLPVKNLCIVLFVGLLLAKARIRNFVNLEFRWYMEFYKYNKSTTHAICIKSIKPMVIFYGKWAFCKRHEVKMDVKIDVRIEYENWYENKFAWGLLPYLYC